MLSGVTRKGVLDAKGVKLSRMAIEIQMLSMEFLHLLLFFFVKFTGPFMRKGVRVKPEGDRKVKRIRVMRIASEPNLATLFFFAKFAGYMMKER